MKSGDLALIVSDSVLKGYYVKMLQPINDAGWWTCQFYIDSIGQNRTITLNESQLVVEG